jgi:hypothetical protein
LDQRGGGQGLIKYPLVLVMVAENATEEIGNIHE